MFFENLKIESNKRVLILLELLLVTFAFYLIHLEFFESGKILVNKIDAHQQYLPLMLEMKRALIEGEMPFWSWKLGLGSDFFSSTNYIIWGDPFNFLVLLLPDGEEWKIFAINYYLKALLCYLAARFYFSNRHSDRLTVVLLSFLYLISGYFIVWGMKHNFFVTSMCLLPLMFKFLDDIRTSNLSFKVVSILVVIFISNFYYAYSFVVFSLLYFLSRPSMDLRQKFIFLIKNGFVATVLASVVLLPIAINLLESSRQVHSYTASSLFYTWEDYSQYFSGFFSTSALFGVNALVILLPFVLLRAERKQYVFIIAFVCAFLFMPVLGSALSWFGYPNEMRWTYGLILIALLWFGRSIDRQEFGSHVNIYLALLAVVMLTIGFYWEAAALVLFAAYFTFKKAEVDSRIFLIVTVFLSIFSAIEAINDNKNRYLEEDAFSSKLFRSKSEFFDNLKSLDDTFYRVIDLNTLSRRGNDGAYFDYNGFKSYTSIMPMSLYGFLNDFNLIAPGLMAFDARGIDNRLVLLSMLSGKYLLSNTKLSCYLDEEFVLVESNRAGFLYENPYALPLFYGYDDIVRNKHIGSFFHYMDDITRSALIDSVLTNNDLNHYRHSEHKLIIAPDASKNLVEIPDVESSDYEVYVRFRSLNFDINKIPFIASYGRLKREGFYRQRQPENQYHIPYENTLLNLGSNQRCPLKIGMDFSESLWSREFALDTFVFNTGSPKRNLAKLKDNIHIERLDVEWNSVTLLFDARGSKLLASSIPYSKGWSAKLNGERVDITEVNGFFLGVELTDDLEGLQILELSFIPNGLKVGATLSLLALILLIIVVWRRK